MRTLLLHLELQGSCHKHKSGQFWAEGSGVSVPTHLHPRDAGASALTPSNPQPKTYRPVLAAASLELKAEKEDAHSDYVRSVAFSPDGKTIVSGSDDQTIKVWDAGA